MDKELILSTIKQNPRYVLIALAITVVIVGGSIWRFVYVTENDIGIFDIPTFGIESHLDLGAETTGTAGLSLSDFSPEKQEIISRYNSHFLDFIAILETGTWISESEQNTLTFKDHMFFENGSEIGTAFAIQILEFEEPLISLEQTQTIDNVAGIYTAGIITDTRSFLVEVQRHVVPSAYAPNATAFEFTLSSSAFRDFGIYRLVSQGSDIALEGNIAPIEALIGQDSLKALQSELIGYTASRHPTATVITFTGTIEANFVQDYFTATFLLNDRANSHIRLLYNLSTGEIAVGNNVWTGGM